MIAFKPLPSRHESPAGRLRSAAAWVVSGRVVGIAATLAANIWAARLLGPAQFGVFLLATTVIACGALLSAAGFTEAILRFTAESLALHQQERARAYLRHSVKITAIATLFTVLLVGLSMAATSWRPAGAADPWAIIGLISIGLALLAWQNLAAEGLRGWHNMRAASLFSGGQGGGPLSNLLFLVFLATAIFAGQTLTAVTALLLFVASIAAVLPFSWCCLWLTASSRDEFDSTERADLRLAPAERRELLHVALTLLATQLLAFGSQQFDVWIGAALLDQTDLGLYGAAKRSLLFVAMPVQMASLTVLSTIPHLAAAGRRSELQRVVRSAASWAAIPAIAALVLLVAFPRLLIGSVFGDSYDAAWPTVLALAAGYLVLVLSGNAIHTLALTGNHRAALAGNIAATVVLMVGGPIGAVTLGAPGLALASAGSLAAQNILCWLMARRFLGIWTHIGELRPALRQQPEPTSASEALLETRRDNTDPQPETAAS